MLTKNAARLLVVGALVGCGSGPAAPRSPTATAPSSNILTCEGDEDADPYGFADIESCFPSDASAVARVVLDAARAEQTGEGYAALWAPGAEGRSFARRARREPTEYTLSPAQMAARLSVTQRDADPEVEVGLVRAEITMSGDRAVVDAKVGLIWGMGEDAVDQAHEAVLVRTADGWRLHSLRVRPLFWGIPDESETYDDAFWDARDAAVAEARAAHEAAEEPRRAASLRALVLALRRAARIEEAAQRSRELTDSGRAYANDWRARAELSAMMADLEDSRAARARIEGAPPPPVRESGAVRGLLSCYGAAEESEDESVRSEVEEDEEQPEPCAFEVLHRVDAPGDSTLVVVLVRKIDGFSRSESTHLIVGYSGDWQRRTRIADGPFLGNQVVGTLSFEVSEPELRDLGGDDAEELLVRYASRVVESGDENGELEIVERGHVVCGNLRASPRCVQLPELVRRTQEGTRTREARAENAFEEGSVRVRARRGRDARIRVGVHPLEALLSPGP